MPYRGRSAERRGGAPRPLRRGDPPSIGEALLVGRLAVSDAGIVYAATLADRPVAVAVLSAGAEVDSFARARFVDAVEECGGEVAGCTVVATGDEPDLAPWVALSAPCWDDGLTAADELLAPVTLLAPVAMLGGADRPARGPDYRPHWADRTGPGRWRSWPLPWPSIVSGAGRWTYVASFALVVAIASIALFIAVKLFEDQPPAPVGPPYPAPTGSAPSPSPSPQPTTRSPSPAPGSSGSRGTGTEVPPIV